MYTFEDSYEEVQEISGDYSTSRLIKIKRDINQGATIFINSLGRKFNKEYITSSLVADQQYYQLPAGALRSSEVRVINGTQYLQPILVTSEEEWNRLNSISTTSNIPTHYYIRGFKEVGFYPVPGAAVTNGFKTSIEPQHGTLTQADYAIGTVTVADGSVDITHSATGFTPQMVGRGFEVTDGTDTRWYKIASYSSPSLLKLENFYEGISGAGRSFRIGEVFKIPNGYEDAPGYHALMKYYLGQKDKATAGDYRVLFKDQLKGAKTTYGRSTSRMGVKTTNLRARKAKWIDLTPPVSYP